MSQQNQMQNEINDNLFLLFFHQEDSWEKKNTFLGVFTSHDAAIEGFFQWVSKKAANTNRTGKAFINTLQITMEEMPNYAHLSPECRPTDQVIFNERERKINNLLSDFNYFFSQREVFIEIKKCKPDQLVG